MSSPSILAQTHVPPVTRQSARPGHVDVRKEYRAHGRELWARFYALCCDRELAWEALQHAFLKLLQQEKRIDNSRAWLLRVGSNWLLDAARSQQRRPGTLGDIDNLIGPVPEPATRLLSLETRAAVARALSQLDEAERKVLVLRYALDWKTQRIADSLGLKLEAVHMRLSRARHRLKALLVKVIG